MTNLTIIENSLQDYRPQFIDVLPPELPVDKLMRTIVMSCERLPILQECTMPSLMSASMTAAVLGLEVDGVTGQAYLLPFKKKAQLVVGYKGYNTLAARAGYTINGAVVRDGDDFDFELGSAPYIKHSPSLEPDKDRRILCAWAVATSLKAPPIIPKPLSIDELLEIKRKAPGARKNDSPWNDPVIGFPAMCEKSAKRRLSRGMPLTVFSYAAAMEQAHEQGHIANVEPGGKVVIDGEVIADTGEDLNEKLQGQTQLVFHKLNGSEVKFNTYPQWYAYTKDAVEQAKKQDVMREVWAKNMDVINSHREAHEKDISVLYDIKDS